MNTRSEAVSLVPAALTAASEKKGAGDKGADSQGSWTFNSSSPCLLLTAGDRR